LESQGVSLLQLPDHCLVKVLSYFVDDARSMLSAARASSRLHQAAGQAVREITAVWNQQQQPGPEAAAAARSMVDSVVLCCTKYAHRLRSVFICDEPRAGDIVDTRALDNINTESYILRELPRTLQKLTRLKFTGLQVQLQPADGHQGVVAAGMPLKQLELRNCTLLDGMQGLAAAPGLAAALALLPGLRYLQFAFNRPGMFAGCCLPAGALQMLPQLTYLELAVAQLSPSDLLQLQGLIHMKSLWLHSTLLYTINAGLLSGMQQLTQLKVHSCYMPGATVHNSSSFDPGALVGHAQLQHLELHYCTLVGGSAGTAQLLLYLPHLQHLTSLDFRGSLPRDQTGPPDAAYSALTASSKLVHLGVSVCTVPQSVWQYVFPADRQLPHLQTLAFAELKQQREVTSLYFLPEDDAAPIPDGDRLVRCCPGLRSLQMPGLLYDAALLAPLTGLTGLEQLNLIAARDSTSDGREVVLQLTGLKWLYLSQDSAGDGLLLQLTQLRQLSRLFYSRREVFPVDPWGLLGLPLLEGGLPPPQTFEEVCPGYLAGHFPMPCWLHADVAISANLADAWCVAAFLSWHLKPDGIRPPLAH
jgi:hypothetical protein